MCNDPPVGRDTAGEEGFEFLDDIFGEWAIFTLPISNESAEVILDHAVTGR